MKVLAVRPQQSSRRRSQLRLLRPAAAAAILATVLACGDGPAGPSSSGIPVARVIIAPDSVSLPRSQTMRLEALLVDAAGNALDGRAIHWTSSDTARVKVVADGTITAAAVGWSLVRASSEGRSDSVKVIVTPEE